MPTLSIKDVPEAWAEVLRERAARNHRSLQGELMAMIEESVSRSPAVEHRSETHVVSFDGKGRPVVRRGTKTPEEVIAELRKKFPEPIHGQPLGVDIIRQDRDSR